MKLRIGLALALLFSVFHVNAAELKDPTPIQVPAGRDETAVVTAIKNALTSLKFTIDSTEPGQIVARYAPRDHVARVTIAYDPRQITITYLDSSNLGYKMKDGKRKIHRNYNRWVNNLAHDIGIFLGQ